MEQILDHSNRAVSRLREQFRRAADPKALAIVFGARTQLLENVFWSLLEAVRVTSAMGRSSIQDETQRRMGVLLGAPPKGSEGTLSYEFELGTQISINKSFGVFADIFSVQFWTLFGMGGRILDDVQSPEVSAYGSQPGLAACVIEASTELVADDATLPSINHGLDQLISCAPAGVRILVGGWTPPDISMPGTLFRLDSSFLDDPTCTLYTMLDKAQR